MKKQEALIVIEKAYDNMEKCKTSSLLNMRHMIDLILTVRKVSDKTVDDSANQFLNKIKSNVEMKKRLLFARKK